MLGNYNVDYTTETHHAKTLGAMGHQVTCLQESSTNGDAIIQAARDADFLVWITTHGWKTPGLEDALARLRHNVPVITYHLDLFYGLERWKAYENSPYLRNMDHFFTVDKLMADWLNENTKTKGHYLTAGVFEPECYMAEPSKDFEVVFVGSKRYHSEWPYRPQLIEWLQQTYGSNFRLYGQDGLGVVRGALLNDLYASTKVVVGDTLCLNFDYPYYWSDRIPETLGRGGFLIHPRIRGLEEQYEDGKHLVLYDYGDFDQLNKLIDHYRANDSQREEIRRQGHEHTKAHHTYRHRWEEILRTLELT